MRTLIGLSLGLSLLSAGTGVAIAQGSDDPSLAPPKVLVIQREYLKPGKSGSLHEKTESAFVRSVTAAKWPTHYIGMDSLSGPSRSLFFLGYDSFAEWEKDNLAQEHNTALAAALDHASIADGDLLNSYESSTWLYHEEYSTGSPVDLGTMRYFEITLFKVRPGHDKEWDELAKLYTAGFKKAVPDARWATFEDWYGADNGGVYMILTPMKALSEVDSELSDNKKFMEAMGESGMKRLSELSASCIESMQVNLFHFNPKISYVGERYIKDDPTFWKPKPTVATKKEEKAPQ
jgi:hypothetical protein